MSERRTVFLERQMYRRHRLVDAIKILPFLGVVLWMLPLTWERDGPSTISTASATVYIFLVWIVLIMLAAVSAAWLGKGGHTEATDDSQRPEEQ
jgi:hypothetical protein